MECHRRSQDFLWGALLSSKKSTFFSRRPQNRLKLLNEPLRPSKSPHRAKNILKIDSCYAWGALTNFPVNYAYNFFSAMGGAGAPTTPAGYACVECIITYTYLSAVIMPVDII